MGLPPDLPGMLEVELVDDDGSGAPRAGRRGRGARRPRPECSPRPDPARRDPRPRPSARVGRRLVAGLVAVAAAGAGAAVLLRDDPVVAVLRPATAPDLTVPPAVLWSLVEHGSGWTVAGDLLLTVRRDGDAFLVTALDLGTGTARWTAPVTGPGSTGVACPVLADGAGGPVLVCRVRGGLGPAGGALTDPAQADVVAAPSDGSVAPAASAGRLVVLDAADGTVVDERPLAPGPVGLAEVEGDLVTVQTVSGATTFERTDLGRGDVVWCTVVPREEGTGGLHRVRVVHDRLVHTGTHHTVLDTTDGRVLGSWPVDRSRGEAVRDVVVGAHGFGVRIATGGRVTTLWHDADGVRTLPGAPVEPALGDGSVPEVALTHVEDGTLDGWVTGQDAPAWSVALDGQVPLLRAAGRVVLAGAGSLRAVDLRTGAELWRTDARGVEHAHAISDGRFVLVTGLVPGTGYALSAVSLTDGSLLWRLAMPPGTTTVELRGGRLLATGAGTVAALG